MTKTPENWMDGLPPVETPTTQGASTDLDWGELPMHVATTLECSANEKSPGLIVRRKRGYRTIQMRPETKSWIVSAGLHTLLLLVLALFISTSRIAHSTHDFVVDFSSEDVPLTSEPFQLEEYLNPLPEEPNLGEKLDKEDLSVIPLQVRLEDVKQEQPAGKTETNASQDDVAAAAESESKAGRETSVPIVKMIDGRTGDKKAELLKKYGGTVETEASVTLGLNWLAKQQLNDGSWSFAGPYSNPASFQENQVAATSMAILAFLGAGNTQDTGEYRKNVKWGLKWLCQQQAADGSFGEGTPRHHGYYTHAQASIAICEAYAMTRDEQLQIYAEKATRFIVRSQGKEGGWRYDFKGDSDTSVTGWCLMALMSARAASIEIPETTLRRVTTFLNSVDSDGGSRYAYIPGAPPTPSMTGEGLLCRMYLGWPRDHKSLNKGIRELSKEYGFQGNDRSYYYWYYATQVMHHAGGKDWERWNESMKSQLVAMQIVDGEEAGSWEPGNTRFDRLGGRLYATCMVLYCLEVYYRHMPIYNSPW